MCYDMFVTLAQPQGRNSLSLNTTIDDVHILDNEDDDNTEDNELDFDILDAKSKVIPTNILAAFSRAYPTHARDIPRSAKIVNRITLGGITYATRAVHEGNNGVLKKSCNVPYSIENILEFPSADSRNWFRGIWFVVRPYEEAKLIQYDPYVQYPLLRAKLWAPTLAPTFEVFQISDIDGHFAKHIITWEHQQAAVIVSLSREHDA